jgi:hypothetical protein
MKREARVRRLVVGPGLGLGLWLIVGLSVRPAAAQIASVPVAAVAVADDYDTTKVVTLKGMLRLRSLSLPPAPAVLLVEVPGDGGKTESWIIAGGPASLFKREGWQLIGPSSPLKSDDVITVSAYLPKTGSHASEHLATALKDAAGAGPKPPFIDDLAQHRGHLAHGIDITLADGKRLLFGERD